MVQNCVKQQKDACFTTRKKNIIFNLSNVNSKVYSCICRCFPTFRNPLNAELNPICHLLALLGAHHILQVSRIRVWRSQQAHKLNSCLYHGDLFLMFFPSLFTFRIHNLRATQSAYTEWYRILLNLVHCIMCCNKVNFNNLACNLEIVFHGSSKEKCRRARNKYSDVNCYN
jgi:hypothetical protein